MLSSDVTRDAERGIHFPIPDVGRVDTDTLTATYRELRERARAAIAEDGYRSGVQIQYAADVRYQGQSHELTVGLASYRSARVIREAFQVAHEERFGFRDDGRNGRAGHGAGQGARARPRPADRDRNGGRGDRRIEP